MVFGRNMIPSKRVDRNAPRELRRWYLAMMRQLFPGPGFRSDTTGGRCAGPFPARLERERPARLIQTIKEWDKRTEAWTPRMTC